MPGPSEAAAASTATAGTPAGVIKAVADAPEYDLISGLDAAAERIGPTVADWLRWLLQLAHQDLSKLSGAAIQDLGSEMVAFVRPLGRMPQFPLLAPLSLPSKPLPRDEIHEFQQRLRMGLEQLFRKQEPWLPGASIKTIEVHRWPDQLVDQTGAGALVMKGAASWKDARRVWWKQYRCAISRSMA